ncbi:hypothetical protein C8R44DRAFT_749905 [Mycena epipterygia]|nr:hypothetical protein C8R44DRAFT_749905 [Mycena epipterygia]
MAVGEETTARVRMGRDRRFAAGGGWRGGRSVRIRAVEKGKKGNLGEKGRWDKIDGDAPVQNKKIPRPALVRGRIAVEQMWRCSGEGGDARRSMWGGGGWSAGEGGRLVERVGRGGEMAAVENSGRVEDRSEGGAASDVAVGKEAGHEAV